MADTAQRTLLLQVKADIEVARTQLNNLVGIFGSTATEVDANLTKIENRFERASQGISIAGVALGSAIGNIAGNLIAQLPGALASIATNAVDTASTLKNAAEALGIGTDALQNFRIGAAKVGVDVTKADSALETFQKTTGKAAEGNKTAAAAFRAVGVDIRDSNGLLKPFEVLILEVADALAKLPDPARQAANAQKLLGESGVELLPFLTQGSKGMNDLATASETLGLKLSAETINRLDEMGNKAEDIKKVINSQLAAAIGENAGAFLALGAGAQSAIEGVAGLLRQMQGIKLLVGRGDAISLFGSSKQELEALGTTKGRLAYANEKLTKAKAGGRPETIADAEKFRDDMAAEYLTDAFPVATTRAPKPGGLVEAPPGPKPKAAPKPKPEKHVATPAELRGQQDVFAAPTFGMAGADGKITIGNLEAIDAKLGDIAVSVGDVSQMEIFDPQAIAAGERFLEDMAYGLASIITQGGNVGDKMISVFSRIGEAWIQSGLMSFLSGGKEGTSFGTIFKGITGLFGGSKLPGFAGGGSPPVGMPYLVGENGPELRIDSVPGMIIPNHALRTAGAGGGGRGATYNSYDLRGALVTEDVLARIDAMGNQAAVRGAVGGQKLAAEDSARRGRRRLGR